MTNLAYKLEDDPGIEGVERPEGGESKVEEPNLLRERLEEKADELVERLEHILAKAGGTAHEKQAEELIARAKRTRVNLRDDLEKMIQFWQAQNSKEMMIRYIDTLKQQYNEETDEAKRKEIDRQIEEAGEELNNIREPKKPHVDLAQDEGFLQNLEERIVDFESKMKPNLRLVEDDEPLAKEVTKVDDEDDDSPAWAEGIVAAQRMAEGGIKLPPTDEEQPEMPSANVETIVTKDQIFDQALDVIRENDQVNTQMFMEKLQIPLKKALAIVFKLRDSGLIAEPDEDMNFVVKKEKVPPPLPSENDITEAEGSTETATEPPPIPEEKEELLYPIDDVPATSEAVVPEEPTVTEVPPADGSAEPESTDSAEGEPTDGTEETFESGDETHEINPDDIRKVNLIKAQSDFAAAHVALVRNYGSITGLLKRRIDARGYEAAQARLAEAGAALEKEKAEVNFEKVSDLMDEKMALADSIAEEFQRTKGWGAKAYDVWCNSKIVKAMKMSRLAMGVGMIGVGVAATAFGTPALIMGGTALLAWRWAGAGFATVGTYETLSGLTERHMTKLKLSKTRQKRLKEFTSDKTVKQNDKNEIAAIKRMDIPDAEKKQRLAEVKARSASRVEAFRQELEAEQAGEFSDEELDKRIIAYEGSLAVDGKKPSTDRKYILLMKEKANRYQKLVGEDDPAGAEAAETVSDDMEEAEQSAEANAEKANAKLDALFVKFKDDQAKFTEARVKAGGKTLQTKRLYQAIAVAFGVAIGTGEFQKICSKIMTEGTETFGKLKGKLAEMFGNKAWGGEIYDPDNFAGYDDMTGQSLPETSGSTLASIEVGRGGSPFRLVDEFLAKNNPKEVFSDAWNEAQATSNPEKTFAKFLHEWKLKVTSTEEIGVSTRFARDTAGNILKDAQGNRITEFTQANRVSPDQIASFTRDPNAFGGVSMHYNEPATPLATPDVRLGGVAVNVAETTAGPRLTLDKLDEIVRGQVGSSGSSNEALRTTVEAGAFNVNSVTAATGPENVQAVTAASEIISDIEGKKVEFVNGISRLLNKNNGTFARDGMRFFSLNGRLTYIIDGENVMRDVTPDEVFRIQDQIAAFRKGW